MLERKMLEGFQNDAPSDQYARAVFYLQKDLGFSHQDIFGGKEYIQVEEKVDREGLIGPAVDKLVGPRHRLREKAVHKSSMRVNVFHAYMKLLEDHYERKKEERKKQKQAQSMKQGATMG